MNASIEVVTRFAIDITLRRGGADRVSTPSPRDELDVKIAFSLSLKTLGVPPGPGDAACSAARGPDPPERPQAGVFPSPASPSSIHPLHDRSILSMGIAAPDPAALRVRTRLRGRPAPPRHPSVRQPPDGRKERGRTVNCSGRETGKGRECSGTAWARPAPLRRSLRTPLPPLGATFAGDLQGLTWLPPPRKKKNKTRCDILDVHVRPTSDRLSTGFRPRSDQLLGLRSPTWSPRLGDHERPPSPPWVAIPSQNQDDDT